MSAYFLALAITLVVETAIVVALFPGRRARMAAVSVVANAATHVLLHFGFPRVLPPGVSPLVVGEVFATTAEAAAYAAASRDLGRSLVASGLANATTFGIGLLIF